MHAGGVKGTRLLSRPDKSRAGMEESGKGYNVAEGGQQKRQGVGRLDHMLVLPVPLPQEGVESVVLARTLFCSLSWP